jgi:hypothetical protein
LLAGASALIVLIGLLLSLLPALLALLLSGLLARLLLLLMFLLLLILLARLIVLVGHIFLHGWVLSQPHCMNQFRFPLVPEEPRVPQVSCVFLDICPKTRRARFRGCNMGRRIDPAGTRF